VGLTGLAAGDQVEHHPVEQGLGLSESPVRCRGGQAGAAKAVRSNLLGSDGPHRQAPQPRRLDRGHGRHSQRRPTTVDRILEQIGRRGEDFCRLRREREKIPETR
jgi:hypothetical protein